MSKTIKLKDVPDGLYRRLERQAALVGMSLSDYLISEIRKIAERPTLQEMRDRLAMRSPVRLSTQPADAVREERDRR